MLTSSQYFHASLSSFPQLDAFRNFPSMHLRVKLCNGGWTLCQLLADGSFMTDSERLSTLSLMTQLQIQQYGHIPLPFSDMLCQA